MRTAAAIVRGTSMEPAIPDGWRVFYSRDPEQDVAGVVGKLCVVKLSEGPTMLKQVNARGVTHVAGAREVDHAGDRPDRALPVIQADILPTFKLSYTAVIH